MQQRVLYPTSLTFQLNKTLKAVLMHAAKTVVTKITILSKRTFCPLSTNQLKRGIMVERFLKNRQIV